MRQLKINKSYTNREIQSLDKYLQDIGHEPVLSPDEEVELARRIKEGDDKALEKLTRANLKFVVSVAKQYQNHGLSLPDLINEGNLGLIKAARKFDETRGFKFISYAVWWIRQSIMQAIAEQGRPIRVPLNQVNSASKIHKALTRFEQEHERRPSEIADSTDMSQERVEEAIKADVKHVSMDAPFSDSNEESLTDVLSSEDAPATDDELLKQSLRDELTMALGVLNERERNVITAFYGIGQPEMTMDEIGKKQGLTRERVRQIRERALRRLRQSTKNKMLKTYLGK